MWEFIKENAKPYELRIGSVSMHSPGMFSFEGLGEPIRELRQLIKDLWFRNRQERAIGDIRIELLRRQVSEHPIVHSMTGADQEKAITVMAESVNVLQELEDRNRLSAVPEFLDVKPDTN